MNKNKFTTRQIVSKNDMADSMTDIENFFSNVINDWLTGSAIVLTGFNVTQKTPTAMKVVVSPGVAYQADQAGQNRIELTADEELTIGASHPTEDRIDIVVAKYTTEDTEEESTWFYNVTTQQKEQQTVYTRTIDSHEVIVVEGTPGAGAPSVPTGYFKLAEILVQDGVTTILDADITDFRPIITDNAIVRWNSSGPAIQESNILINDTKDITQKVDDSTLGVSGGSAWDKGAFQELGGDDATGDVAGGSAQIILKNTSAQYRIRERATWGDLLTISGLGDVKAKKSFTVKDSDGTHKSTFQGGDQSADIAYTLPAALPDSNKFLQCTTGGVMSFETPADVASMPIGALSNLKILTADSNTVATITCDSAILYDSTAENGKEFKTFSCTVDITASGAGGLDTGTEATSTWYYIWLIGKADGTKAGLLSASDSAPTLPSGYTYKRIVGTVYNNSSGNFEQFIQHGNFVSIPMTAILAYGTATSSTEVSTIYTSKIINSLWVLIHSIAIAASSPPYVFFGKLQFVIHSSIYTAGGVYGRHDGTTDQDNLTNAVVPTYTTTGKIWYMNETIYGAGTPNFHINCLGYYLNL